MTNKIYLLPLLILFASCEKCYQCTYSQQTIQAPSISGNITRVNSEFCGTKKEKADYEKAGTSTARHGNITVITKNSCN